MNMIHMLVFMPPFTPLPVWAGRQNSGSDMRARFPNLTAI